MTEAEYPESIIGTNDVAIFARFVRNRRSKNRRLLLRCGTTFQRTQVTNTATHIIGNPHGRRERETVLCQRWGQTLRVWKLPDYRETPSNT